MGYGSVMWGNGLIFDKRLKNVDNDLEIWEMAKIFGNCLDTLDTALVFESEAYYVGNGLRIDKRFKYVGNDVYIWEMPQVFEKRLNYV